MNEVRQLIKLKSIISLGGHILTFFCALVNCNHIIMAMISFGIMLILFGSIPWSQSLSFVTTVTMVTHSFYNYIIIIYLVLFHLYHERFLVLMMCFL